MARLERTGGASRHYWIKDETGDRIGLVWGLDGVWRWSLGNLPSREADSFESAKGAVEEQLGAPLRGK
ncbi:MAG: hypothetical protein ACK5JM_10995 [Rhodoblastus sp.]